MTSEELKDLIDSEITDQTLEDSIAPLDLGDVLKTMVDYVDTKSPLASPTFTGTVTLPSTTSIGGITSTEIGYLDGVTSSIQTQLDNKVTSVQGTTNRIISSGGANPVINISSSYVGQLSLTTLGTIGVGTWQGTPIADSYIASSVSWNTAYTYSQVGHIPLSQKGVALGVVPLNSSSKIDTIYLPDIILGNVQFGGTYNGTTISANIDKFPELDGQPLPLSSSYIGVYFISTDNYIVGGINYSDGDWIISIGSSWTKIDNSDAVTSVFGRIGNISALSTDYSAFYPLLSGSYNDPSWIASLPYSKITGTPSLSVYVPYIGASGDLDLGSFAILATSGTISGGDFTVTGSEKSLYVTNTLSGKTSTITGDGIEVYGFTLKSSSSIYTTVLTGSFTANRNIALPDGNGTLALTSDILPLSLMAIGSSPNANGATVSGMTLTLQPASASFGGIVTTGIQTIAGEKTLNSGSGYTTFIGADSTQIKLYNSSNAAAFLKVGFSSNANFTSTHGYSFVTNNTGSPVECMRISASGVVAIGSTSGSGLFNVGNSAQFIVATDGKLTVNGGSGAAISGSTTTGSALRGQASGAGEGLYASTSTGVAINAAGNSGIAAQLISNGGNVVVAVTNNGAGPLQRWSNSGGQVASMSNAGVLTANSGSFTQLGITGEYTLPTTDGLENYVLTTDGLGNVFWGEGGGGGAGAIRETTTFTATAGQTTFTILTGYIVGSVDVFVNGVKLNQSEFTATNGSTVEITGGVDLADIVEIVTYTEVTVIENALRETNIFTATSGQTTFSVLYTPGLLDVFYNGAKLAPTEYTATNGTSIILSSACFTDDIIEVIAYNYTVGGYSGIGGLGTTNKLAKFTAGSSIGDSSITDTGSLVTFSTDLEGTSATFSGNITVRGITVGAGLSNPTLANPATIVGYEAGLSLTIDENENTAIGYKALRTLEVGFGNTAVGSNAMTSAISYAEYNTAVGSDSLWRLTTGNENTAIGYSSLDDITTGSYNVAIGYGAGGSVTTGSGNVFIGYNAFGTASMANNIIIKSGGGVKAQHDGTNWTFTGGATITGALTGTTAIFNGNSSIFGNYSTVSEVIIAGDSTGNALTKYRYTGYTSGYDVGMSTSKDFIIRSTVRGDPSLKIIESTGELRLGLPGGNVTLLGPVTGTSATFSGYIDAQFAGGYRLRTSAGTGNLGGLTRSGLWEGGAGTDVALWAETGASVKIYSGGSGIARYTIDASGNNTWAGSGSFGGNLTIGGRTLLTGPLTWSAGNHGEKFIHLSGPSTSHIIDIPAHFPNLNINGNVLGVNMQITVFGTAGIVQTMTAAITRTGASVWGTYVSTLTVGSSLITDITGSGTNTFGAITITTVSGCYVGVKITLITQ